MEVLRVPPYPIVTTWNLPDANYGYIVYVEDLIDHSIEETVIFSDENGILIYELPLSKVEFDREFLIRFYDAEHQHIIYEEGLNVIRPYVNPTDLGTTPSEVAQYKIYEVIARSVIDTYINDGFYNHKSILQAQGNGIDYMPVWRMANRVLKVYENNILIYNGQDVPLAISDFYDTVIDPEMNIGLTTLSSNEYAVGETVTLILPTHGINGSYVITEVIDTHSFRVGLKYATIDTSLTFTNLGTSERIWAYEFGISLDNSAIIKTSNTEYDRLTQHLPDLTLPISRGDIQYGYERREGGVFISGHDYLFVLDEGFRAIPPDVARATTILIEDVKCGKLDYYQRGVSSYSTDQFKLQFDKTLLNGTGNILVDRMLDKYIRGILKIGVI